MRPYPSACLPWRRWRSTSVGPHQELRMKNRTLCSGVASWKSSGPKISGIEVTSWNLSINPHRSTDSETILTTTSPRIGLIFVLRLRSSSVPARAMSRRRSRPSPVLAMSRSSPASTTGEHRPRGCGICSTRCTRKGGSSSFTIGCRSRSIRRSTCSGHRTRPMCSSAPATSPKAGCLPTTKRAFGSLLI